MTRTLSAYLLVFAFASTAAAQDLEPNNVCRTAPDAGVLQVPVRIDGSLDAANASPRRQTDVDFYRFTAEPGLRLRARVSEGANVALFQPDCFTTQDVARGGKLDFTVPETGVATLAVAHRGDSLFSGSGSENTGPYRLEIDPQPPFIGSITGRVTDQWTGLPLGRRTFGTSVVALFRCASEDVCESTAIDRYQVDSGARFRIERAPDGRIETGRFRLVVSAPEHANRSVDVVVGEEEELELGDVSLLPPELQLMDIRPCAALPPQGGTCEYSVRVLNNTAQPFVGTAFSRMRNESGFFSADPSFETSTRQGDRDVRRAALVVPPFDSRVVTFFFDVPSFLANGTNVCTDVYVGVGATPVLDVRISSPLFCLVKGARGMALATAEPLAPEPRVLLSDPVLERESNNSCATAQDAGVATIESTLSGSLDFANRSPRTDVDYFRFTAEPGLRLTARIPGLLGVRKIGVFDDACVLRAMSPSSPVLIDFDVPQSGVFVLAVAEAEDEAFDGNGFVDVGPYELVFSAQPPFIGSITGRLVDARSRRPLGGNLRSASVELGGCNAERGCSEIGRASVDANGRFTLAVDDDGRRIQLFETYRIRASATAYGDTSIEVRVAQESDLDAGDIALTPPLVQLENLVPCEALPPAGGTCRYSVDVLNNTETPIDVTAFSSVEIVNFIRIDGFTFFEATGGGGDADVTRPRVEIPAFGSATVRFAFQVAPASVFNRAPLCVRMNLGYEPFPLFDRARSENLFCVSPTDTGFSVTPASPLPR